MDIILSKLTLEDVDVVDELMKCHSKTLGFLPRKALQKFLSSNGTEHVLGAKDGDVGLIRFGGHLPKGEYDVDHDGHEGQADAAELHG